MHDVHHEVRPGLLVEDAFQGRHVFVCAHPVLLGLFQLLVVFLLSNWMATRKRASELRYYEAARISCDCHSVARREQAPVPLRPCEDLECSGRCEHLQVRF